MGKTNKCLEYFLFIILTSLFIAFNGCKEEKVIEKKKSTEGSALSKNNLGSVTKLANEVEIEDGVLKFDDKDEFLNTINKLNSKFEGSIEKHKLALKTFEHRLNFRSLREKLKQEAINDLEPHIDELKKKFPTHKEIKLNNVIRKNHFTENAIVQTILNPRMEVIV